MRDRLVGRSSPACMRLPRWQLGPTEGDLKNYWKEKGSPTTSISPALWFG